MNTMRHDLPLFMKNYKLKRMCKANKIILRKKMKQMETIIKILLEGIHITLKMMMSNLIWHILIKCPELEITAKYTHDAILSAGNAQIYYHRKTGIFLYFPKQMFWVLKLFVPIYNSRRLKLSLLTWMEIGSLENYGLPALYLQGTLKWLDLKNMRHISEG